MLVSFRSGKAMISIKRDTTVLPNHINTYSQTKKRCHNTTPRTLFNSRKRSIYIINHHLQKKKNPLTSKANTTHKQHTRRAAAERGPGRNTPAWGTSTSGRSTRRPPALSRRASTGGRGASRRGCGGAWGSIRGLRERRSGAKSDLVLCFVLFLLLFLLVSCVIFFSIFFLKRTHAYGYTPKNYTS